ncbi:hypothetical protein GCM10020221_35950 [Streptomyces thioluteus]|uniref:Uncharacterized protein n=1 Tax=Streptomyces thioluteus TaxID=66431 RepID=A0ABN3X6S8_STRTU
MRADGREQDGGPGRPGVPLCAPAVQSGDQTGAQEGGLARSGGADENEWVSVGVGVADGVQQTAGDLLAAVEVVPVPGPEGFHAGVRAPAGGRRQRVRRPLRAVRVVGGDDQLVQVAGAVAVRAHGPVPERPVEEGVDVVQREPGRPRRVALRQQAQQPAAEEGVPLPLGRVGQGEVGGGGEQEASVGEGRVEDGGRAVPAGGGGAAGEAAVEDHDAAADDAAEEPLERVVRDALGDSVLGRGAVRGEVELVVRAEQAVAGVAEEHGAGGLADRLLDGIEHLGGGGVGRDAVDVVLGHPARLVQGAGQVVEGGADSGQVGEG